MNIFSISAVAIIISVISLVLKKDNRELSICVSIVGSIIVLSFIISYSIPIFEQIKELSGLASIDNEILLIIFKSCGICFIAGFASQSCKDFGENSLAMHIETAARVIVMVLCLPLISNVLQELLKFTEV